MLVIPVEIAVLDRQPDVVHLAVREAGWLLDGLPGHTLEEARQRVASADATQSQPGANAPAARRASAHRPTAGEAAPPCLCCAMRSTDSPTPCRPRRRRRSRETLPPCRSPRADSPQPLCLALNLVARSKKTSQPSETKNVEMGGSMGPPMASSGLPCGCRYSMPLPRSRHSRRRTCSKSSARRSGQVALAAASAASVASSPLPTVPT